MSPSFATIASAFLPLVSLVSGHMVMTSPAPIRYADNPNTVTVDYNYNSPLSATGDDFPCKGYTSEFTGSGEGTPVATWAAGSSQSMIISGGAAHNGGSCQASISEDGGSTFKVIKSYIGNCPLSSGTTTLPFTVPSSAKSGNAIFAWTWFNNEGNREMYMNCAAVTISGGGSGLSSLPDIFEANIGNGCSTAAGADVLFPNPGDDVTYDNTMGSPVAPSGTCGTASSGGSSGGTSPAESSVASTVIATAPAATSTAKASVAPTSTAKTPSVSTSTAKAPSVSTSTRGHSRYGGGAPAASATSVPEAIPSDYNTQPEVPECKRSVRYTRSLPVAVQPGCQCSCENNKPVPVCGSSL